MITELTTFDDAQLADLDLLMHQLNPNCNCTSERLREVVSAPDSHLYVVIDGTRIVGCATLCVLRTPEMRIGCVEAVTVLESCRGRGLGRLLMEHILEQARVLELSQLHLTSNPRRVAANALYQALGFVKYDTNCYHLYL